MLNKPRLFAWWSVMVGAVRISFLAESILVVGRIGTTTHQRRMPVDRFKHLVLIKRMSMNGAFVVRSPSVKQQLVPWILNCLNLSLNSKRTKKWMLTPKQRGLLHKNVSLMDPIRAGEKIISLVTFDSKRWHVDSLRFLKLTIRFHQRNPGGGTKTGETKTCHYSISGQKEKLCFKLAKAPPWWGVGTCVRRVAAESLGRASSGDIHFAGMDGEIEGRQGIGRASVHFRGGGHLKSTQKIHKNTTNTEYKTKIQMYTK